MNNDNIIHIIIFILIVVMIVFYISDLYKHTSFNTISECVEHFKVKHDTYSINEANEKCTVITYKYYRNDSETGIGWIN